MPKHSEAIFRFRQFVVCQQQSAMKICTDSLLFGAMAPLTAGCHVLDIGCGTGLLALMVAQQGAAKVTAVELFAAAYQEAADNFANSPWAEQLSAVCGDIRCISGLEGSYDLIISNPPFFDNHQPSLDKARCAARHNGQLGYAELLVCAHDYLADNGLFYVLVPTHAVAKFHRLASLSGWHLNKRTDFQGRVDVKAKVAALCYAKQRGDERRHEVVVVYRSHNVYSETAARYLSPYLLRFERTP